MKRVKNLVLWALAQAERWRFVKFGIVGASGTVVNVLVLHIGHEYIFRSLETGYQEPHISLAFAIMMATINNFAWNRLWTWSDRIKTLESELAESDPLQGKGGFRMILTEFGQYATATALGSFLQYVLALQLTKLMDYRLASLIAIAGVAVVNYMANDRWTFRKRSD